MEKGTLLRKGGCGEREDGRCSVGEEGGYSVWGREGVKRD